MTLYKKKYRVESIRLPDFDYAGPGRYFITICTKDMRSWFGCVKNEIMGMNKLGCVAYYCWNEIKDHFDSVELHEFVIMPNHVHGIIEIVETKSTLCRREPVETGHGTSLWGDDNMTQRRFGPLKPHSISIIINQYKGAVKRWANKHGYESFIWQSRYYDRIIRDDNEYCRIVSYIKNNPSRWDFDKNDVK
jgi:REP element-mobilizing transposase RayT